MSTKKSVNTNDSKLNNQLTYTKEEKKKEENAFVERIEEYQMNDLLRRTEERVKNNHNKVITIS